MGRNGSDMYLAYEKQILERISSRLTLHLTIHALKYCQYVDMPTKPVTKVSILFVEKIRSYALNYTKHLGIIGYI